MAVSARTVLVIDDEEPIRDAVRTILEEEGYTVLDAPDGLVGLELLRTSEGHGCVVACPCSTPTRCDTV